MRKKIIIVIGSLITVCILAYCLYVSKQNPTSIKGYPVIQDTYTEQLSGIGYVEYSKEVSIKSEIGGYIKSLNVKEGNNTLAKDILLTLDDHDAQLKYDEIKANINLNKARYKDYMTTYNNSLQSVAHQQLVKQKELDGLYLNKTTLLDELETKEELLAAGAIPRKDVDDLKNQIDLINNKIDIAKVQLTALTDPPLANNELSESIQAAETQLIEQQNLLTKYTITSPLDGIVSKVYISEGQYIQPGEKLMDIVSPSTKTISLAIDEKYLSKITINTDASLYLEAYENQSFKGVVSSISPTVDATTGTIDVTITINEHPEYFLKDASVRVEFKIASFENALMIKGSNLIDDNGLFVYEANKNGIVTKVPVTIYNKNQNLVYITDGLTPDSIVLDPTQVKEGMKVTVSIERDDAK